jgi:hypothetical protein
MSRNKQLLADINEQEEPPVDSDEQEYSVKQKKLNPEEEIDPHGC